MPPQIKQDLNRSGWESTDFPSVCEKCLPDNPYVKMLKEDYGAECKLVSLPDMAHLSAGTDHDSVRDPSRSSHGVPIDHKAESNKTPRSA